MKKDLKKQQGKISGKENSGDDVFKDNEKYKYHQSQKKGDKEHSEEYGDKPENHTTPEERMLNPHRGEKK